jgi:hypothetical protein
MSLQPKLKILSQDTVLYGSITLQDDTGVYNLSTNPGGFGSPNPLTGDVQKTYLQEEYMGDDTPGPFEEVNKLAIVGPGLLWEHDFREGVAKINYLIGVSVGVMSAYLGNTYIDLVDADDKLANCTHIEIDGKLYPLDGSRPATSTRAFVTRPIENDYTDVNGYKFYQGYVYTLWNTQGYNQLVKDIADVACTSIACGAVALEYLMVRLRFYEATGYNFTQQNYSKAHNLAAKLAPEMSTANCITC